VCGSPTGKTDAGAEAHDACVVCFGCGAMLAHLNARTCRWIAQVADRFGVKSIRLRTRGRFPIIEIP
jgi:hypothetical protein